MKIISIDDFEQYLINRGYKVVSKAGNKSTTYDYSRRRIPFVMREEGVSIYKLAENIDYYINLYDSDGPKSSLGAKGKGSVINALRRFREYINVV